MDNGTTIARDSSFFQDALADGQDGQQGSGAPVAAQSAREGSFFSELRGEDGPVLATEAADGARSRKRAERRIAEQERDAALAGFPEVPLLFSAGTPLAESGKGAYRESRVRFERQPFFGQVCDSVMRKVESEHREDVNAPLACMFMKEDGSLMLADGRSFQFEEPAFRDYTSVVGMHRAGAYLGKCPPWLRADNVNYWLDELAEGNADRTTVLRTRNGSSPRRVFACVSTGYRALDADNIASILKDVIPEDAKGEAVYDGFASRFTALFHAEAGFASECAVGDNYKAGVSVRSDDTGSGSLIVRALLYQAQCINLTTAVRGVDLVRQSHKGVNMEEVLRRGVSTALAKVGPFITKWNEASRNEIISANITGGDVEPAFVRLVAQKLIPNPGGVNEAELLRRLRASYWKAPSPTVRGISDAITRAAHENSWSSPWSLDTLQDAAGELVHQHIRIATVARGAINEAQAQGWAPTSWTLGDAASGAMNAAPIFSFAAV